MRQCSAQFKPDVKFKMLDMSLKSHI